MLPERWSEEAAMNSQVSGKFSIQNMVNKKKKVSMNQLYYQIPLFSALNNKA